MFGSIVALITPYFEDGNVDIDTLKELVEWQVVSGSSGIVLCGSTGEGWALDDEEKIAILEAAVDVVAKRVPVILNCGTASTRKSAELVRAAKETGADMALVVLPYYVKPSFSGCKAHFATISDEGLPLMLYHHPGRTGIKLSLEQLLDLGSYVSAYKEASGDMTLLHGLIQASSHDVYAGDDAYATQAMEWGAKGVVSVIGNAFPLEWQKVLQGEEVTENLQAIMDVVGEEINPQGIKTLMALMGKCRNDMRLPLVTPSKSYLEKLESALTSSVEQV